MRSRQLENIYGGNTTGMQVQQRKSEKGSIKKDKIDLLGYFTLEVAQGSS